MGVGESNSALLKNNPSSTSSGRISYSKPSYRIDDASESNLIVRSSSSNLGGPTMGERRYLLLTGDREVVEQISSSSSTSLSLPSSRESPPLIQWLIPALICAFAYSLYNIFIKKGSAFIHPILGGVILQFVAAMVGSILCVALIFGPTKEEMFYDSTGIVYAALAGAAVGMAEIISFTVSGMGVPAVRSIPIIIGGSVMFGTIIGRVFLAEALSLRGWLGVFMIASGISLIGMESN